MIEQSATTAGPVQGVDEAAEAAEGAAMAALRLTLAAYAERARVASRLAHERLEEAKAHAAKVGEDDGDWELRHAERAAHESALYAQEANLLCRIHHRYSEQLAGGGDLLLFDTLEEDTLAMLKERDEIDAAWELLVAEGR